MGKQGTNLFIVDNNIVMVNSLEEYLKNRFGQSIHISTFKDGNSCLRKVNEELDIVILDCFILGKNNLDILKSIKTINPKTEVIMLAGNEDMAIAIKSFRNGAADYVVKGKNSWKRISKVVNYIITKPVRIMEKEFSVSKQIAILIFTSIVIGIIVILGLWIKKCL